VSTAQPAGLDFRRHGAALLPALLGLALLPQLPYPPGVDRLGTYFALAALLHALTVAASLRTRGSGLRLLAFLVLSMGIAVGAMHLALAVPARAGMHGRTALLLAFGLAALGGAVAYALLVSACWPGSARPRSLLAWSAALCTPVTMGAGAALLAARAGMDRVLFTTVLGWWAAFSGSLWLARPRTAA
jgi:hypothetical protein